MTEQKQKAPFSQKRKYTILIVLLVLLLAASLTAILFLALRDNHAAPDTSEDDLSVIGGGEKIPEDQGKEKIHGSTHLPAYSGLTFAAGKKEQELVLKNPGENTCLIRISLILADGTTVYTSELVEPGYYTRPITLKAPMERGIYRDATLKYECFTYDENRTPLNGATSRLDITVK